MAQFENLSLAFEANIAILTIDRPKALNALNSDVLKEMQTAINEVRSTDSRVLIITGGGDKAFVAGGDIAEMSRMDVFSAYQYSRLGHSVLRAVERLPIPVIAAVNGYALGGGCELALACDIIIASETAMLGQPEVGLGIIPGFGGTQRLTRVVGLQQARLLVYSGRRISAEEALRIGLVAQIFPREGFLDACKGLAREIAANGPLAVQAAKQAIRDGSDLVLEAANELESRVFSALFETADQKEGTTAFVKKLKPKFTGA